MTEVEHASDSGDNCSKVAIGRDSGVDPNACAKNGMLQITTTPLSEMVWSQQEGLSLQHVASSLGEKKASMSWNTEYFNIVVSSPKCADCGRSSKTEDQAESDFNMLQLKPNCEAKDFHPVLSGFSRYSVPSRGETMIRIDEHESSKSPRILPLNFKFII